MFASFEQLQLTPVLLRAVSQHQTARIVNAFERLDLPPNYAALVDLTADRRAGFVAIRTPAAARVVTLLHEAGVHADARGAHLRLGPAPYMSDAQLDEAMARVGAALRAARSASRV